MFGDWSRIWLTSEFRDWNIEEVLESVQAPTLLIQGRADQYGTMRQLDAIQAKVPGAVRVEIENCGHSPHLEARDVVIEAISALLDGRE